MYLCEITALKKNSSFGEVLLCLNEVSDENVSSLTATVCVHKIQKEGALQCNILTCCWKRDLTIFSALARSFLRFLSFLFVLPLLASRDKNARWLAIRYAR